MGFIVLAERMDCRGVFGVVAFLGGGVVMGMAIIRRGWWILFCGGCWISARSAISW